MLILERNFLEKRADAFLKIIAISLILNSKKEIEQF